MDDAAQPLVLQLWSDSETTTFDEIEFANPDVDNRRFLRNVTIPTLTAFLPGPSINTGTAMIVCPGGGLFTLAIDYEGYDVARWLCQRGIAAFVLKYRVVPTHLNHDEFNAYFGELLGDIPRLLDHARSTTIPLALADGQRAITMVRERAREWHIQPDRIGMMGFSAGAFLTIMTTLRGAKASRPDFVASIYGALWEDLETSGPLPPLFIALSGDDALSVEPSLQLYTAWRQANSPVEMHIFSRGGHGFSMRNINPAVEAWIERMIEWMQVEGLVKK